MALGLELALEFSEFRPALEVVIEVLALVAGPLDVDDLGNVYVMEASRFQKFDTVGTFACEPGLDPATNVVTGDTVCAGSVGAVLTATVNFVLIAFALFFVVKAYNRMNREDEAEPEPEADPEDVVLLREIRDSLRAR